MALNIKYQITVVEIKNVADVTVESVSIQNHTFPTAFEALRFAEEKRAENESVYAEGRPKLKMQFSELCLYTSINSLRVYARAEWEMALDAKKEFEKTVSKLLPTPPAEENKEAQK